jgi:cell division protein FtsB
MCKQCNCQSSQGCCGEHVCRCECGDHTSSRFERRFQTKAEQIAELEAYLGELKAEVQAVEEHLADLR